MNSALSPGFEPVAVLYLVLHLIIPDIPEIKAGKIPLHGGCEAAVRIITGKDRIKVIEAASDQKILVMHTVEPWRGIHHELHLLFDHIHVAVRGPYGDLGSRCLCE